MKHQGPKSSPPPVPGQGGTIWINCDGDTTPLWWGSYRPGTTPPANLTAAQKAELITKLQTAFDGVSDTPDGAVYKPINITFQLGAVPLTMGKSMEIVVGGTGAWTGNPNAAGFSDEGGAWFSSMYWGLSQGKAWVFSEALGNSVDGIKIACIHELIHFFGYTDAGEAGLSGDYYGAETVGNNHYFTAAQWAMLTNMLGTK